MTGILLSSQFLLIGATNFSLFLVLSTWSFLPLFIVDIGGNSTDVGLIMGSIGITTLGSLPFVTPLMDRYGRKPFIVGGALVAGVSNAGFFLFDSYSLLIAVVRLIQGAAFAACFNGCSTAVVDLVPAESRAQGIGLFGVSSSLAVAIGPYLGEKVLLGWGFDAYFLLLVGFGLTGFFIGLLVKEPPRRISQKEVHGFFPTALRDHHLPMMAIAALFGSGFGAMNYFFPLYAKTLGLHAGIFFVSYGVSLLAARIVIAPIADRVRRETLILACLVGFGSMLLLTSAIGFAWHTIALGVLFGVLQGLSYPALMARMVDRSRAANRAVVVGLFTGSFGAGINGSVLVWGVLADLWGLKVMYLASGAVMLICASACAWGLLRIRKRAST